MNVTKQLYQWDTGQKLTECTGIYVDFLIKSEVYRIEVTDGTCIIPDELLQTSGRQKVWECMADNTLREFAFWVLPRPVPPDYVFTPTERLTFEGLVQRVDDAVADMIRRANSGEFDGHTPVKGTDYFTASEIQQIQNEVSSGAIGEFKSVVDTKTETFNTNAETKLNAYNQNDSQKTTAYNSNATEKMNAYNANANNRVAEFDSHTEQIQSDVNKLKSDLVDSHKNIADFITLPQLLDNSQFIEGKELQNTALVSTPNDMDDVEGWTTTNIIELNWEAVDGNRTFETNLKTGQFKALGYYLRNGEYVRSASVSATEEYNGHYKFSIPELNTKMRISIYTKVVNADDIIITKLDEWTDTPTYARNEFVLKDEIIKKNNLAKDVRLELYPENPCHYRGNEFQIFKNVICIGDSLTEGTFDYFEGATRKYFVDKEYSYPTILSALTGRNVLNKGYGGDTFQSWYNRYKDEDLSGFDCAIIELGLNDSTQGTTSEDRLTYLGNIVNKLKLENNGIKIFISTIFKCYSNSNIQSVNADIISFANSTENCYLMNVYENGSLEPNTPYVSGHLTVLGYQRLARDYYAYASKIIADNISEFQFVQYIGSTKQYQ